MFPYIFVYSISFILFHVSDRMKYRKSFPIVLALLLLALLAGLRNETVGTDTSLYVVPIFNDITHYRGNFSLVFSYYSIEQGIEELYLVFNGIVSLISTNTNVFLFALHFLMVGVILIAIRITNVNVTFAMYQYIMVWFATTMNAARQSVALAFCLLAFSMLIQNYKIKWVFIVTIIAYGFHHSALIFIIIFLMYKIICSNPSKFSSIKMKLFYIICGVLGLLFFNQILVFLTGIGIGEEKYLERYGSSELYGSGLPISVISLTLFNLIMFYLAKRKCGSISNKGFTVFSEYILLISVVLCGSALIATFAIRINLYFIYLSLIILPYYIIGSKNRSLICASVVFYCFYWIMVVMIANLSDTNPYVSKILGIY